MKRKGTDIITSLCSSVITDLKNDLSIYLLFRQMIFSYEDVLQEIYFKHFLLYLCVWMKILCVILGIEFCRYKKK